MLFCRVVASAGVHEGWAASQLIRGEAGGDGGEPSAGVEQLRPHAGQQEYRRGVTSIPG